jgi:hypothetical protein
VQAGGTRCASPRLGGLACLRSGPAPTHVLHRAARLAQTHIAQAPTSPHEQTLACRGAHLGGGSCFCCTPQEQEQEAGPRSSTTSRRHAPGAGAGGRPSCRAPARCCSSCAPLQCPAQDSRGGPRVVACPARRSSRSSRRRSWPPHHAAGCALLQCPAQDSSRRSCRSRGGPCVARPSAAPVPAGEAAPGSGGQRQRCHCRGRTASTRAPGPCRALRGRQRAASGPHRQG